jgi:hypothetical protein
MNHNQTHEPRVLAEQTTENNNIEYNTNIESKIQTN